MKIEATNDCFYIYNLLLHYIIVIILLLHNQLVIILSRQAHEIIYNLIANNSRPSLNYDSIDILCV